MWIVFDSPRGEMSVIKEKVDYVIDVRISAKFDKDGKCQEGGPVFNPFKVRKNTPAIWRL